MSKQSTITVVLIDATAQEVRALTRALPWSAPVKGAFWAAP
jgi:hypothetical protein